MPGDLKVYSLEEVSQHAKDGDVWIVIHDKVYDVSKFLDEHPGGEEVLRDMAGHVATENFEDVGHSTDARELMQTYLVGEINEAGKQHTKAKQIVWTQPKPETASSSWMVYVAVAVAAFLIYLYMS